MNKETKHSNKAYPARPDEERQYKHADEFEDTSENAVNEKDREEQKKSDPYKQDMRDNRLKIKRLINDLMKYEKQKVCLMQMRHTFQIVNSLT
jgi:hypothetical protein